MRRISSALNAIISTLVNVITLPFRVLGRLVGGGGRRRTAR
ncbi:LPFR motif small protein [Spirillospora sp. NPDC127200]